MTRGYMMGKEVIRDNSGNRIGEIESNGTKQTIRDKNGNRLGEYDSRDNITRDKNGNRLGTGNTLTRLL